METENILNARYRASEFRDASLLVHYERKGPAYVRLALDQLEKLRTALDLAELELKALEKEQSDG